MTPPGEPHPRAALDDIVIHSALIDGTPVCLRAVTPDDELLLREGIAKLSSESRYLRFFSPAPMPPDSVVEHLVDVDGHDHIAWGALNTSLPGQPAIGAVHAIRHKKHTRAGEYSVGVLDEYHGKGLARMMTAALLIRCRDAGIAELQVNMLSENAPARRLVKSMGATWQTESAGIAEFRLDVVTGIAALRADLDAQGVQDVFRAFDNVG